MWNIERVNILGVFLNTIRHFPDLFSKAIGRPTPEIGDLIISEYARPGGISIPILVFPSVVSSGSHVGQSMSPVRMPLSLQSLSVRVGRFRE